MRNKDLECEKEPFWRSEWLQGLLIGFIIGVMYGIIF